MNETFNREKTIFGSAHIIIFGLSIGLIAWIAKISPSLLSFITSEVIETAEAEIGVKYSYQDLEISSFVFFALLILISFCGIIANFKSKEPKSTINIKTLTISMGVILTIFAIPLIITGALALEDNKTVNDFEKPLSGDEKEAVELFKQNVNYEQLGIASVIGGGFVVLLGLFTLFWYFYKMRKVDIEMKKDESLMDLEPKVSLRPQTRNL